MSDRKHKKWADLIQTGGAETFFDSFPEDAELAEQINSLFPDPTPVTADQISRDRRRFYKRPRLGERIKPEEASPTKQVIRNKALQLEVQEAFAEILDNIFDNFQRNKPERLEVEIVAHPKTETTPGEIVITENSGGIERRRVVPLIQLGLSERSVGGIGAWGEGFKMAVFALGEEVEVFSTYSGEPPIAIHFPRGWLDPDHSLWTEWKVNTYKVGQNPPPEGTTIIRVNHVHLKVLQYLGLSETQNGKDPEIVCERLADYFGEVYAEKYHDLVAQGYEISIRIAIGSASKSVGFKERVKARLVRNLVFLPWLLPIHWVAKWETRIEDENRIAKLGVEIYAGLAATFAYSQSYSPQDPGVEMWGNGRLFSLKGRISDVSVGWGYKFGGSGGTNPTSTASSRRMTIVALFTSDDSRNIPWAAPVKNDYNRRSEFYAEIQDIFAKVIRLFKDALSLLESRLLPFSYEWTRYSDKEKLDILFASSDATPEFKQQFAETRFGKKLLAFQPDFSFHEIKGSDADVTVSKVYNIPTTTVKGIVRASAETKNSAEQVVELLKALFWTLYKEAEVEEKMGLKENEELGL
jgi:hypothetical protein